ncbi:gem-associated protein 7 [Phaenicophaeus curvirostris]|uniref:gem-associated protein 7 n=1 Tax=Phaenicophaeus curvirostris TaxID=33595 RepID=UPI0037F10027
MIGMKGTKRDNGAGSLRSAPRGELRRICGTERARGGGGGSSDRFAAADSPRGGCGAGRTGRTGGRGGIRRLEIHPSGSPTPAPSPGAPVPRPFAAGAAMAVPVPVLRLPRGPEGSARGFRSPRSVEEEEEEEEGTKAAQGARAALRLRFLRALGAARGRPARFRLRSGVCVDAELGAADVDAVAFQVDALRTPLGVQAAALLRCSDVLAFSFPLASRPGPATASGTFPGAAGTKAPFPEPRGSESAIS